MFEVSLHDLGCTVISLSHRRYLPSHIHLPGLLWGKVRTPVSFLLLIRIYGHTFPVSHTSLLLTLSRPSWGFFCGPNPVPIDTCIYRLWFYFEGLLSYSTSCMWCQCQLFMTPTVTRSERKETTVLRYIRGGGGFYTRFLYLCVKYLSDIWVIHWFLSKITIMDSDYTYLLFVKSL